MNQDNNVYLDYAASTPVRDEVVEAMQPYRQDKFANPQSSHTPGKSAREAVEQAREKIADTLQVQASEIIFTSGATEANSLALAGRLKAAEEGEIHNPKALVSAIDHSSLADCKRGESYPCELIPVRANGLISQNSLADKFGQNTAVASVGYVNNEIGTIQPLAEIASIIQGSAAKTTAFHTDASQAGLFENVQPQRLGVDMMTINGHKLYGPKGIGLLWVRSGTPLHTLFINKKTRVVGDYQAIRPGTPPTPLIVGLAEAIAWAQENRHNHKKRVQALRDQLIAKLKTDFPAATINGSTADRIANNVSVSFPDTDHAFLVSQLNKKGIAVSAASACQNINGAAHAVQALPTQPDTAVRISLGVDTTPEDIDVFISALKDCRQ